MLRKLILLPLILLISNTYAQQNFHSTYTWESKPEYALKDKTKDIVSVKEKVVAEFLFEGEKFVEYFIEHKVFWLNSDDAIEQFNKIYLPLDGQSTLTANKARVIKKSGEIVELDESKILSANDDETGRQYKYFAFEGVEKGSFIEYFYIQKKSPSYSGKRIYFQGLFEKNNLEFDLYAPQNLDFQFKSYNGLDAVQKDTSSQNRLHWNLKVDNIEAMSKEEQAPFNASRAFLIYKLDKNLINNAKITSYASVAKNITSFYYQTYNDTIQKELDKMITASGIKNNMTADEKIRRIDFHIKSNLYYTKAYNESLEDMKSVLANKAVNERGAVKLFVALLDKLEIEHEIVLTSDRMQLKFDNEFEANNFLQEFLLYFPSTKKYLSPSAFATRYGFPPPFFMDNYGLFIKNENEGAVAEVRFIEGLKANKSLDVMSLNISFDKEDLTINNINLKRSINGYYAMNVQPFLDLIIPDRLNEFLNSFAKNIDENAEVVKREVKNDKPELFGVKPMEISYEITSESFVEKAGNRYLFKLGDLIGPQIEMYQEKKRKLPLETQFTRVYDRTIKVEIPEGYKISNLDDINIENRYKEDGKDLYFFHSFYSLDGNTLTVTADEEYHSNIIPANLYEQYRKVINSAADFNKVTLILEKK